MESFFSLYKQNDKLPIRLISPDFGRLPPNIVERYDVTHRKTYYFFIFICEGAARHGVDLEEFDIYSNELLFILPNQIHRLPGEGHPANYFKIGFDEYCLALLPKQYPFLINPLNNPKIKFNSSGAARLKLTFEILQELLTRPDSPPELILAHLNSLLAEINAAYFTAEKSPAGNKLSAYTNFRQFVESNLTGHVPVHTIAEKLALNTNSLYTIVKHYSGLSPKEFITNRLILEAKRRLYYSESSIKEIAYDLGYNDPEYFSRLFKKATGTTIAVFVQDLSGK